MPNEHDTGAALRSLYTTEGGVSSVFTERVADYVASRPDYPVALFETLAAACAPAAEVIVADVGSGTGLLTQGLLRSGYRVVAVEPNPEMRRASDSLLGGKAGYRSVEGGGETMPLASGSIDLITVAQAFHWFDAVRARVEFLRVLKAQGQVALVWNDRVLGDALHIALDEIFAELGGAKRAALVVHEERANVAQFFGVTQPRRFRWPHSHRLDEAGLLSLLLSRSYMPKRNTPEGRSVAERGRKVFGRFGNHGTVEVRYQTVAFLGRPG